MFSTTLLIYTLPPPPPLLKIHTVIINYSYVDCVINNYDRKSSFVEIVNWFQHEGKRFRVLEKSIVENQNLLRCFGLFRLECDNHINWLIISLACKDI